MPESAASFLRLSFLEIGGTQVVVNPRLIGFQASYLPKHRQRTIIVPRAAVSDAEQIVDLRIGGVSMQIILEKRNSRCGMVCIEFLACTIQGVLRKNRQRAKAKNGRKGCGHPIRRSKSEPGGLKRDPHPIDTTDAVHTIEASTCRSRTTSFQQH